MSTRSTASETVTVYGIKSCDTMKKAINWLTEQGIPFELHDYKKVGVEAERLKSWLVTAGPDKVINRRGTTWRALSDADKAACE
ncbi:MAG: ArsC/Spx/MgsR family protein, partial [Natronospirillum sp.]